MDTFIHVTPAGTVSSRSGGFPGRLDPLPRRRPAGCRLRPEVGSPFYGSLHVPSGTARRRKVPPVLLNMLHTLLQTAPTTAPANETPWERVVLALIAAAAVVALAWLKRMQTRQDKHSDRQIQLAKDMPPPAAPVVTRPTHSTETEPPCDVT